MGAASWDTEQGKEEQGMNIGGKQNNQDRGAGRTKEKDKVSTQGR